MKNDSTFPITNSFGTQTKLLNLSKKLSNYDNEKILAEFHACIYGSLESGKNLSNLRNLDEMKKYVSILQNKYNKLEGMTESDVELYHRLFVNRFGREIKKDLQE
ncbi:hypothetical protein ABXW85_11345 [Streptococcus suis]